MAKEFELTKNFKGYREKTEETNLGEIFSVEDSAGVVRSVRAGFLVKGSQNVLFNDGERIAIRKGYTLDGDASTSLNPIEGSFEWDTHRGVQIPLRSEDDELQFRNVDSSGNITWNNIQESGATAFTDVSFNFATVWDATEGQDFLLFVNGTSNLYDWSGGITTFASATSNSITKEGTTSWAEEGFLIAGTRRVIIEGTAYAYTGGESTTTLTGVTPDPTVAGHTAGKLVHQQIRINANQPSSSFNADLIEVIKNQVYLGATDNRTVFVSKNTSFTDYTFSSPRLPGEGALLTLDGASTALIPLDEEMVLSAGKDQFYEVIFTLSDDLTKEKLEIKRLKTTAQEGAISQGAVSKIKNNVVFINNEPTLDTLGRIENIDTNQSKPLSDPVKGLFDRLDFTNVHVKYFKNNIYVAVPAESLVLIYNLEKSFWEAPQVLPIRRLAIIDGELYGHSNAVPETYRLLTGTNDNTNPINAVARFGYQNFERRDWQKSFDEFFTEGFISSNTELTLNLRYEFEGAERIQDFTISGNDSAIIVNPRQAQSLGKTSLGKRNLGGSLETITDIVQPKFRVIHGTIKTDFYEFQVEYSSNEVDFEWEIIAFGGNILVSKNDNNSIKK